MVAWFPLFVSLIAPAQAALPGDSPAVAKARADAEKSILEGQRFLFKSKYWPTFKSEKTGFTVKIPSHEEATETKINGDYATYKYELGVPFDHRVHVIAVHTPAVIDTSKVSRVVESLAEGKFTEFGARPSRSSSWANGTQHSLSVKGQEMVYGVRVDQSSIYQLWVTAPSNTLDETVVSRIFDGFTPIPRTEPVR